MGSSEEALGDPYSNIIVIIQETTTSVEVDRLMSWFVGMERKTDTREFQRGAGNCRLAYKFSSVHGPPTTHSISFTMAPTRLQAVYNLRIVAKSICTEHVTEAPHPKLALDMSRTAGWLLEFCTGIILSFHPSRARRLHIKYLRQVPRKNQSTEVCTESPAHALAIAPAKVSEGGPKIISACAGLSVQTSVHSYLNSDSGPDL